ncbi:MAG: aminotransferase class I/II-fold pyridoxal phosphate-dependent enzyme, partial [Pseudomonadota bacterium]
MTAHVDAPAKAAALPRPLAERSQIGSFKVMDVMRAAADHAARGETVIHMEVGQPGTGAPRQAIEAVAGMIGRDTLGYTLALGRPELRARIALHYRDHYGVDVAPERIVITSGSSAGFVLAYLMLFADGETVALPSPGYPCYRQVAQALGVRQMLLTTGPEDRWMPTARQVADAYRDGATGLLLASPANPTGT